ncbi:MAG: DNA topoisomerase 4 subunit B [Candidatus Accumulibacter regalis]|jgi:topoisomerase-4 subunit B|uniref:DNA topoisomerase 4 subunit B n=1 Tax=Accumulibacter regalis TaxID=522306 RepID=A0A011QJ94_ACCRE|nr:DNA topoisomerase IV subunit B [Accumulibacter sp.]EXI89090.1 MAG: DNA topoisomerase 4 subunit B [Candidatus Accumulibacter regalis]MQM33498.1 type IIA DNA topoisomerase subunit B [Candidatus Accumulibacter phosphatis]MBL8367084.1 type IIA DNA topoisomerase subunit B [Accumulibacter sp.]MBN8515855.1 type IIA DNA topoisomerase subunit B [Accumulibacter sp.]HRE71296.1 DNA topoisomerase IV subunit B [Accumulibacter sp.]
MSYTAESIAVLKGLEPVRHRPGMYTRIDCPLHIIQEAIDNAADEALGGFCKRITVTLHADQSVSVEDDGRGIPVEIHPLEQVPTVEVVFTRLHAGGKFNKDERESAYRFSGGLHGVGVSVTNALSTRLEVEVVRDGGRHRMAFAGGNVLEPLQRLGDAPKRASGTRVRAWPDASFFDSPLIPLPQLERLLRSKALLLPGLQVVLNVEGGATSEWCFADGMLQYLSEQIDGEMVAPVFSGEKYAPRGDENFPVGSGAAWAICWTADGSLARESYVNLIPTPSGGTHEAGLRQATLDAVKSFADHHALLPKGVKLAAEDVFSRASFVLAVRMLDPSFQGQTKERLNSRDAVALVARMLRDPLELWLNEHPDAAKKITDLAIRAAQARTRAGQKVEKRKQSGVAILPGKLSDCQSEDTRRNEIFLVEGDSAGGSAKSGRDKELQAILPLRGKVLNTWEVDAGSLFANREVHDIAVALGIDPHPASAPDTVLNNLRYGKVVIMTDADVDGSHIRVLLCTLFYRHFPKLIASGHLYFAQPPLFRLDVPGQGKNRPPRKLYALDGDERLATLDRLRLEGIKPEAIAISRFKGLGEMNPEQLWETTMSPDTRRLMRIRMPGSEEAKPVMQMLMGKSESAGRRAWMEDNGALIGADI